MHVSRCSLKFWIVDNESWISFPRILARSSISDTPAGCNSQIEFQIAKLKLQIWKAKVQVWTTNPAGIDFHVDSMNRVAAMSHCSLSRKIKQNRFANTRFHGSLVSTYNALTSVFVPPSFLCYDSPTREINRNGFEYLRNPLFVFAFEIQGTRSRKW